MLCVNPEIAVSSPREYVTAVPVKKPCDGILNVSRLRSTVERGLKVFMIEGTVPRAVAVNDVALGTVAISYIPSGVLLRDVSL